MPFELWPYTNFHDLNLDWIMMQFPKVYEARDEATAAAEGMDAIKTAAENARDAAIGAKDDAATAAAAALGSKNAAAQSANAAAQSVTDAQTVVNGALGRIGDATAGAVADWLDAHVDPDTGYVIDDTLTVSGAAADARVTGLRLSGLGDFWVPVPVTLAWEQGGLDGTTGAETVNANSIRTGFIELPAAIACTITDLNDDPGEDTQIFKVFAYTSDDVSDFDSASGAFADNVTFIPQPPMYIRITAAFEDASAIVPGDAQDITVNRYMPTDTDLIYATGTTGHALDSGVAADEFRSVYTTMPGLDSTLSQPGNFAAQAKATGDAIGGIMQKTVIVSPNLLNPANITEGYYYKAAMVDGREMVTQIANAAFSCGYIDVVSGQDYIATGISYNAYNGDADGYAIGIAKNSSSNTDTPTFDTTNVNSAYNNTDKTITRLYFSWKPAKYATATFMINSGTTLEAYQPYGTTITKKLAADIDVSEDQVKPEIYYVDVNGTGDYSSLMDAFVDLATDTHKKIIYVLSGTYDIYTEIGGAAFVNSIPADADYWDYITIVPPNTSVIGIGGVTLTYLPTTTPGTGGLQCISPINIADGDVHLENLKIICTECRYGIHDQVRAGNPNGYTHSFSNVTVIKDDDTGYYGKAQALGGGLMRGANLVFDNCLFASNRIAFSYHNASNGYANISLTNCAFYNFITTRGHYPAVRFGNVSGTQVHIPVMMTGCTTNDEVLVTNETATERPNAFDVTMINCTGDPSITVDNQTNIYTPIVLPE